MNFQCVLIFMKLTKTFFLILVYSPSLSISVVCVPALQRHNLPLMLCSSCSLVYGMVPFLNAILGTMLPMLCMAKQDNMKWVFSSGKKLHNVYFELWYFSNHLKHDIHLFTSAHIKVKNKKKKNSLLTLIYNLSSHDNLLCIIKFFLFCFCPCSSLSFQRQYFRVPCQLGQSSRSHSQKRHIFQWNLCCFWHPLQ